MAAQVARRRRRMTKRMSCRPSRLCFQTRWHPRLSRCTYWTQWTFLFFFCYQQFSQWTFLYEMGECKASNLFGKDLWEVLESCICVLFSLHSDGAQFEVQLIHIQYPPQILAPLVNMSKDSCGNKSASLSFWYFIKKIHKILNFHWSKTMESMGKISLWNKCFSLVYIGHNY